MRRMAEWAGALLWVSLALPMEAFAFCGFYVSTGDERLYSDATMVVLMREGTRTVLSMQNNYQGPAQDFALVVPVPSTVYAPDVRTLEPSVFEKVDRLSAPRLAEYWERDPCPARSGGIDDLLDQAVGGGRRGRASFEISLAARVRVEARFRVGEYRIVILGADDSSALVTWLRERDYALPPGAERALDPYVQQGTRFFVAKVDPARVRFQEGRARLSPLRVAFDAETFALPIRLGRLSASGPQDLIVHIIARESYVVANRNNVMMPTGFQVPEGTQHSFAAFYERLFDRVLEEHPGAVVTEYIWQTRGCDPCPTPPLTPHTLATLGGDEVGGSGPWTLTRLHYRYDERSPETDLVFRVEPAGQFQTKFDIVHPWKGTPACANPEFGVVSDRRPTVSSKERPLDPSTLDASAAPAITAKMLGRTWTIPATDPNADFRAEPPEPPGPRTYHGEPLPPASAGRGGCASCHASAATHQPWSTLWVLGAVWLVAIRRRH